MLLEHAYLKLPAGNFNIEMGTKVNSSCPPGFSGMHAQATSGALPFVWRFFMIFVIWDVFSLGV